MAHFIERPQLLANGTFTDAVVQFAPNERCDGLVGICAIFEVEDVRFSGTPMHSPGDGAIVRYTVEWAVSELPSIRPNTKAKTMPHFIHRPVRNPIHSHIITNALVQYGQDDVPPILHEKRQFQIDDLRFSGTPVSVSKGKDGTVVDFLVDDLESMVTVVSTRASLVAGLQPSKFVVMPEIMRYFEYEHLPTHLQEISRPLHGIAAHMVNTVPASAELSAGLRKLLEAKDCFVRAALPPKKES